MLKVAHLHSVGVLLMALLKVLQDPFTIKKLCIVDIKNNSLSKISDTSDALLYIIPSLIDEVLIALNTAAYIALLGDKSRKFSCPE